MTLKPYLQIGRIPVALVRRRLQLLVDPALEFVCVALEVHEQPRVLEPTATLAGRILEVAVGQFHDNVAFSQKNVQLIIQVNVKYDDLTT